MKSRTIEVSLILDVGAPQTFKIDEAEARAILCCIRDTYVPGTVNGKPYKTMGSLPHSRLKDGTEVTIKESSGKTYTFTMSGEWKRLAAKAETQSGMDQARNVTALTQLFKQLDELYFTQDMLTDLSRRIEQLRLTPDTNQKSLKAAEELMEALTSAVKTYLKNKTDSSHPEADVRKTFVSTTTKAINTAMTKLMHEGSWGAYLQNLAKALANIFLSAANKISNSNFTFFELEKAVGVSEAEDLQENIERRLGAD